MSAPAAHRLLLPQLHALAAAAASSAGARLLLAPPGAWHDSSAAPQAVRAASSTPAPDASSHPATGSATGHRRPRFYRTVGVAPAQPSGEQGPGYQVFLDARPIKTPGKNALVLPSYSLALAIAAEWEWQRSGKPQMHTMPMMSIAATALDQPKPRATVVKELLKFAHTDVTCCRYEPGKMADRQAAVHDPLLSWAHDALGWGLRASSSVYGPTQPEAAISAVQAMLQGLDPFQLAAMEQLIATCKSVVIAAALLRGRLTPHEAFRAARVEEDVQIEEWGMVEAGHDLDIVDVTTRITAPSLFLRLLADR